MISDSHDALPGELQSVQQVAELYGLSLAHVRLLARSRHLGRDTGDGEFVFSSAEVAALRPRGPGRPWAEREIPWVELA